MRFGHVQAVLLAVSCSFCRAQNSVTTAGEIPAKATVTCAAGGASQQTPFSLVQVQTVVQTLGNGTQVRGRTEIRRIQDGHGRMRTETSREVHGAMQLDSVSIYDPSRRETITLHPRSHVADIRRFPAAPALSSSRPIDREYGEAMRAEYESQKSLATRYKTEQLEPRTILNERVVGVRTTIVIPAGERGNDSELRTIHESWDCPRIGLPLLSTSDDPITGRVKDEITELSFEAPDPSLFLIPAGYRIFDLSLEDEPAKP